MNDLRTDDLPPELRDPDAQAAWRPYLDPGERLLWSGRPAQGLRFRAFDAFIIPFFIVWVSVPASILFFISGAPSPAGDAEGGPSPLFFAPFYIMPIFFLAIGFYMLVGRFFVDAWIRGATLYALTDRRALIQRRWPTTRFKSIGLRRDLAVDVSIGARSTFRFGAAPVGRRRGVDAHGPGGFVFEGVADGEFVYRVVRAAQNREERS